MSNVDKPRIVKVKYSDGKIIDIGEIKPLEILESDSVNVKMSKNIAYWNQFKTFETVVLETIDEEQLKEYATTNLEMVEEVDIDDPTLADFSEDDIISEVLGYNKSIVAADFLQRFVKIIDSVSPIEIHRRLSKMEEKFKVV